MTHLEWLPGTLKGTTRIKLGVGDDVTLHIKDSLRTQLVIDLVSQLEPKLPFLISELAELEKHFDLEFSEPGFDTDSSNNYHAVAYFDGITFIYQGGLHKLIPNDRMAAALRKVADLYINGEEEE